MSMFMTIRENEELQKLVFSVIKSSLKSANKESGQKYSSYNKSYTCFSTNVYPLAGSYG